MTTVERTDALRIAMRFSLWAWAAYWPGGGLLLAFGGLDPVSLAFATVALASFLLLLWTGALRPTASRNLRQFALERPIYLVAALGLVIVASGFLGAVANLGLALFAAVYLASILVVAYRAVQLAIVSSSGGFLERLFRSKADQLVLTAALMAVFALLVFLDAIAKGASGIGTPAELVAFGSWLNLAYPALLLVAARPFREPLHWSPRLPKPASPAATGTSVAATKAGQQT